MCEMRCVREVGVCVCVCVRARARDVCVRDVCVCVCVCVSGGGSLAQQPSPVVPICICICTTHVLPSKRLARWLLCDQLSLPHSHPPPYSPSQPSGANIRTPSSFSDGKKKSLQHQHFPCGPPPQYYTGCTPLNFTVRMGRGVFGVIWP